VSGGNGAPHHAGIPVAERYEEWLGRKWPGAVRFAPGGQFMADGRTIRQHPKALYERLLSVMADEWNPWVMERLWPTLLEPPRENLATFSCQATPVTTYLRCELPARYLPAKVSREIVRAEDDKDFWYPDHEGTAIMQFAADYSWALNVHGLQHKGHRVLVESDDNYFVVAPSMKNTGWTKSDRRGHSLEGHASILRWVDGCIVTTEYLAKQYRKHCPNVYVCPNAIDPLDWPVVPKRDDGILRIGWFASNSHMRDVKLVKRALGWAAAQPDVEVITMGMRAGWADFPHTHIGWQNLPSYREAMLHELDIGVAPVVPYAWSNGRSDVKALEKAFAGAALVLSDVDPYSLWTHEENCLKAKDAGDFYRQIRRLVENRDEVKQLAKAGRDYVVAERTIHSQVHKWRDAIMDEYRREVAA
jgi:glycosyltransferase involved in cell wall biosynthesis